MVTLAGIHKAYGGRVLFRDVALQINRQDRIGLVGPNGAGKTTLFSILLNRLVPDEGTLTVERNVMMGYLPQESAPVEDESVLELAAGVTPELLEVQRRLREGDAHTETLHAHEVNPHARYAELQGYQIEAKAKQILAGLGFRETDYNRPARTMSGGWVMRTHLARLLVQEPDLLLLDEPTNHLDLEALLWFQSYLQKYPGAILVISHDREFLNRLVGHILEIRQSRLIRYRGNYEDYLEQRQAQEAQWQAAYSNQQREIDRLMAFVNRFRAKNTKAAQAQSKLKQIARMEKIEAPIAENREISFRFPQPERSGQKVITLKQVHFAYGDLAVYRGVDFVAERGQRIVLVGPNGAGKSTLLKLLAGALQPQSGHRILGHNAKSGYYSQYRTEMLHSNWTVLEEALDTPQAVTEQFVRTLLGCFLFQGDDVFKRVNVLSGGEKSRLALVKLLLDPPNLLLMDEPTTHLDMSSIDALLAALDQFEGTLVFISHDVYFIRSLANHVTHVHSGALHHYKGDYQYYLDKTSAGERQGLTAGGQDPRAASGSAPADRPGQRSKERKRQEAEERQARARARRDQQKRVDDLEARIHAWESRQLELTAALEDQATYQQPGLPSQLNRELSDVTQALDQANRAWEIEAATLETLR